MQFLANENFPLDAVEAVRKIGHDVAWIRTDAPGSKDRDILNRSMSEQRILLTFDKDFGNLAFQFGLPATCGIVFFRLQASSSAALARIAHRVGAGRTAPRLEQLAAWRLGSALAAAGCQLSAS